MIDQAANQPDNIDVGPLVPPTDVISFADAAIMEHPVDAIGMIFDIQPVPDMRPITVYWQLFTVQHIDDDQRNQLFGKMIGPVVVRAITRRYIQSIGVMLGSDEKIRGCFARGVRSASCGLGECRIISRKATVNLIS